PPPRAVRARRRARSRAAAPQPGRRRPANPPRRALRKGRRKVELDLRVCSERAKIPGLGMDFRVSAFYNSYWREQRTGGTTAITHKRRGAAIRLPFLSERTLN